jgi:hypothetical protein
LDDMYVFLVRGPSSRLPRGYVWLIPIWFAALGAALVLVSRRLSDQLPLWLGATELGSMVLAGLILIGVLHTVRCHAFRVNASGIWLGVRTTRKRPRLRQIHLAWLDIAQVRMVRRHYGLLLEITLAPAARIVDRYGLARQALLLLGALFMPLAFGRGRPAITTARADPPRYLVRVCDVAPPELRHVVTELAPPSVLVRVLKKPVIPRLRPMPPQRPGLPLAGPLAGVALPLAGPAGEAVPSPAAAE